MAIKAPDRMNVVLAVLVLEGSVHLLDIDPAVLMLSVASIAGGAGLLTMFLVAREARRRGLQ